MNPGNANGGAYSVCYFRVGSQDEAGAGVVNAWRADMLRMENRKMSQKLNCKMLAPVDQNQRWDEWALRLPVRRRSLGATY